MAGTRKSKNQLFLQGEVILKETNYKANTADRVGTDNLDFKKSYLHLDDWEAWLEQFTGGDLTASWILPAQPTLTAVSAIPAAFLEGKDLWIINGGHSLLEFRETSVAAIDNITVFAAGVAPGMPTGMATGRFHKFAGGAAGGARTIQIKWAVTDPAQRIYNLSAVEKLDNYPGVLPDFVDGGMITVDTGLANFLEDNYITTPRTITFLDTKPVNVPFIYCTYLVPAETDGGGGGGDPVVTDNFMVSKLDGSQVYYGLLSEAYAAAVAGEAVHMYGDSAENIVLKNGVDIQCNGYNIIKADGALPTLTDNNNAVICNVFNPGRISRGAGGSNQSGLLTLNPASTVNIYGGVVEGYKYGALCQNGNQFLQTTLRVTSPAAVGAASGRCEAGSQIIEGTVTGVGAGVTCTGGTQTVRLDVVCEKEGAVCTGGIQTIYGSILTPFYGAVCVGSGRQIIHGNVTGGENGIEVLSAGSAYQEIRGNVFSNKIGAYGIGGTQVVKGNVTSDSTAHAAAYCNGIDGSTELTCLQVIHGNVTNPNYSAATCGGFNKYQHIFGNVSGGTATLPTVDAQGVETIVVGHVKSTTGKAVHAASTGKFRFEGRIETTAPGIAPMSIGSSNGTIKNLEIISTAAATECISAAAAFNLIVYPGCVANKSKHANVTEQVSTILISASAK